MSFIFDCCKPVLTFEIKVTWYFLEMNKRFHILCHSVAGSKIMKQIRSGVTFDLGFVNTNTPFAVAWSLGLAQGGHSRSA